MTGEGVTTVIMLGGTGDLSRRELVPALFTMHNRGLLPLGVRIIAFARSRYSDDEYRDFMEKELRYLGGLAVNEDQWATFARSVFYVSGDLNEAKGFASLKQRVEELEGDARPTNRLFYLAIPPHFYEAAIQNLGASGLAQQQEATDWCRVVVEKPFGWDLASAQSLDLVVHRFFSEGQVFRIDHFLGKETVQNLLVFRFANAIFEPVWNRNYIDNVQITAAERIGVGDRGSSYDRAGVIRDMMQNHLLQLLALVAMEPPSVADPETLRSRKIDVLKAIRRRTLEEALGQAVFGQYEGYLREKGVSPRSQTPTYAALRLFVDNWRWQGVPFYLRTGKAMATKATEIVIQFRRPPHLMFAPAREQDLATNALSLCLQRDEGIHLKFEVKVPGQAMAMRSVLMEFHHHSPQATPEAYVHLLQDVLEGDPSHFIPSQQVEEAWKVVGPLLQAWETEERVPLRVYESGSWGPEAADDLLAPYGHSWQLLCPRHEEATA